MKITIEISNEAFDRLHEGIQVEIDDKLTGEQLVEALFNFPIVNRNFVEDWVDATDGISSIKVER